MAQTEPFNGIATFVVAARSRSFTEAADRLGITKSAVGKGIARLEERLGTQLFHRTTRRISLTADGEAYFATCAAALDDISSMEEVLVTGQRTPKGRLRIDMPASFGRRFVLPILLEIAKECPGLQLTMTFTDHLIDPIEEGVDLLIRFGELQDSSGLIARRLTRQKLVICGSPEYLAARGTPKQTEDLGKHDCIVGYRRGQPLAWIIVDTNGAEKRVTPTATHAVGDGDAILATAEAGCGLCQMPSSLVRDYLDDGRLRAVLDEESKAMVDVHVLWPKTRHLLPKVRRVVDALLENAASGALD